MNSNLVRRLEIYREFISTLRATKGVSLKVDELDELYGVGWRKDQERIISIDQDLKAALNDSRFLSPGLFTLDAEETGKTDRMKARTSDKPRLRKAQTAFVLEFVLAVGFVSLALWIATIFVPVDSKLAETIGGALMLSATGCVVASYRKYRRALFD